MAYYISPIPMSVNRHASNKDLIKKITNGLDFDFLPFPILLYDGKNRNIVDVNNAACALYGYDYNEFCNLSLDRLLPKDDNKSPRNDLLSASIIKRSSAAQRHLNKKGELLFVQVTTSVATTDYPDIEMAVVNNISDIVQTSREVELLVALATSISKSSNLNEAFNQVITEICKITNWEYGEFWLYNAQSNQFEIGETFFGQSEGFESIYNKRTQIQNIGDDTITKDAFASIGAHLYSIEDEIFAKGISDYPRIKRLGVKSYITVPVQYDENPLALLVFMSKSSAFDDHGFLDILKAISHQLSVFIQEKILKERKKLFELIVTSANDAVLVTDANSIDEPGPVVTYANPQFEAMTGYSAEEMIGQSPRILQGPKTDRKKLDQIRLALSNNKPIVVDLENYRKDGTTFWVEISIFPLADDTGRMTHFVSIQRDINEWKKIGNQLKLQASMLDEVSNAIIVVDKNNNVSYWNKQAEVLYKFHKSEMVGHRNSGKIFAQDSLSMANEAMRKLQYEGFWRGEMTMQRKDGSTFIALVSNRALLDENGDFTGYIGVSTDITELKRIQNTLESSVHEKEVLLKEIHHRVKNNMQIISSLLHLQALQSDDALINEVLVESQSHVRTMSMVHEKLYKSVDLSKVSLADYTNELAEELLHTWTGTKLQVNRHFNLDNIELSIEQAIPCGLLLNELISNAVKHGFNRHNSGNLYIRLYSENGHVCIEVANDGSKLPESFNLKQTESLGTQLIDSLTEQLMGSIIFESEPITKFTVKFPYE